MELKKLKSKKNLPSKEKLNLPLKNKNIIKGIFNGQFVSVSDINSMIYLHDNGSFGKGSFSKGEPYYHIREDDLPKVLLLHQWENLAKWNKNVSCFSSKKYKYCKNIDLSLQSINNLLQSSFSDFEQDSWESWKRKHKKNFEHLHINVFSKKAEVSLLAFKKAEPTFKDDFFINIVNEILQSRQLRLPIVSNLQMKRIIALDSNCRLYQTNFSPVNFNSQLSEVDFPPEENLNLNLEESFFLSSVLGCLHITDLSLSKIELCDLWKKFCATDKSFFERYVTYHYYRTKGWVVKSGLKFGGDFLLYKIGPAYFHSSYLVKVLDKRKKLSWREFTSTNRLVETFNKDLLLCNVLPGRRGPSLELFPQALTNNKIQEVVVKRWFPSKERFAIEGSCSD